MQEVLNFYMPKIEQSDVLSKSGLENGKYFIVSIHREENVDTPENLRDILATLRDLADEYGFPILISTHPRTAQTARRARRSNRPPIVALHEAIRLY